MKRSLFRRTRPVDLERELDALRDVHASLPRDEVEDRRALALLIRSRERLRRRLQAGLPVT